jgi:hypothetical protein
MSPLRYAQQVRFVPDHCSHLPSHLRCPRLCAPMHTPSPLSSTPLRTPLCTPSTPSFHHPSLVPNSSGGVHFRQMEVLYSLVTTFSLPSIPHHCSSIISLPPWIINFNRNLGTRGEIANTRTAPRVEYEWRSGEFPRVPVASAICTGKVRFRPHRYGNYAGSAVNGSAGAVTKPYLDGRARKSSVNSPTQLATAGSSM